MRKERYPISPNSFKKTLEYFSNKIVIKAIQGISSAKTELIKEIGLDYHIPLIRRYKMNPYKKRSSVKIYPQVSESKNIGSIYYLQLSYSFERKEEKMYLKYKFFVKRIQCKKYRVAQWTIIIKN